MARQTRIHLLIGEPKNGTTLCGSGTSRPAFATSRPPDATCPRCQSGLRRLAKSWNVEATDGSGWAPNGLYFATEAEGQAYARDLFGRWMACKETRVVRSLRAPNYRWVSGVGLVSKEVSP